MHRANTDLSPPDSTENFFLPLFEPQVESGQAPGELDRLANILRQRDRPCLYLEVAPSPAIIHGCAHAYRVFTVRYRSRVEAMTKKTLSEKKSCACLCDRGVNNGSSAPCSPTRPDKLSVVVSSIPSRFLFPATV